MGLRRGAGPCGHARLLAGLLSVALASGGLAGLAAGCASWGRTADAERAGSVVAARLVAQLAAGLGAGPVAWAGVRDESGHRTPETQAIDDHLLSAVLAGALRVAAVDSSGADWDPGVGLPVAAWRRPEAPVVLGARLHPAGAWSFVRLLAVDGATGAVVGASTGRLAADALQRLAARSRSAGEVTAGRDRLQIQFELLATRVDGSLTRQLEVNEGGTLLAGDRLQARLLAAVDCEVHVFLYDSEGVVTDLLPSQFAYAEHTCYGPGQDEWVTLGAADRVHTLYVVAGRHLPEDRAELWERLAELRQRGLVDRFVGLPEQDRVLAEFVGREVGPEVTVAVQRGPESVRLGKPEELMLADGTRLRVRPELLAGSGALVRAVSFAVQ